MVKNYEELPLYLTPQELADAWRVHLNTVYTAISRNQIPGVHRIGRQIRIDKRAIFERREEG